MISRADMTFARDYRRPKPRSRQQGPLHVRRDEEPDVSFVVVSEIEKGCGICGNAGHSHRFCPSDSVRAERYG